MVDGYDIKYEDLKKDSFYNFFYVIEGTKGHAGKYNGIDANKEYLFFIAPFAYCVYKFKITSDLLFQIVE